MDAADTVGDDDVTIEIPAVSRKVRHHARRTRQRSKTIALKRLTRAELALGAALYPPVEGEERPRTRAECKDQQRPCPWVACKHHLYLDINPRTGSIKLNFPELEPWELAHTCALDLADEGARTLEEIGELTNLTRERVRQVEVRGLLELRSRSRSLR
ncbi:MAG TPA: sigma factor-like helix-turn-helix DNA-binding protein [Kofleriaceae bacterium]|nr:sigma factor-like helix-turn-helix DNA-binding protein [Kofleriaceae bacterium]